MRYDYKCECGNIFEVDAKMSETTPTYECPECKKDAVKYYQTAANLVFKGGDWSSKKIKHIDPKEDWVSRRQREKWE